MKKIEIFELKTAALNYLKGGAAELSKTKTVNGVTNETRNDKDSAPDHGTPPKELIG